MAVYKALNATTYVVKVNKNINITVPSGAESAFGYKTTTMPFADWDASKLLSGYHIVMAAGSNYAYTAPHITYRSSQLTELSSYATPAAFSYVFDHDGKTAYGWRANYGIVLGLSPSSSSIPSSSSNLTGYISAMYYDTSTQEYGVHIVDLSSATIGSSVASSSESCLIWLGTSSTQYVTNISYSETEPDETEDD